MSLKEQKVYLTDETLSAIKKRAVSEGKSTSEIAREMIEDGIGNLSGPGGGPEQGFFSAGAAPEQIRKEVDSAIEPVLNAIVALRGEVAGIGRREAGRENARLTEILKTVQEIERNIKAPSPEIGKKLDEILGLLNRSASPGIPGRDRAFSVPEKHGIFRRLMEGIGNWWNEAYWPGRTIWILGVLAVVVLIGAWWGWASTPSPVPGLQK